MLPAVTTAMRQVFKRCLLPACMAVSVLALTAHAEPTLRLVADPWPPFTDHHLPENGLASDVVQQALQRAGYQTHYHEAPWERAVHGLQRGDYDILINAWYSEERTGYGAYSSPYLVNRIRVLKRLDHPIDFARLQDLYRYRIAAVRGYAYSAEFDRDPNLQRVGVMGFESAARMLQAGRVDLAVEDEQVARYHLGPQLDGLGEPLGFLPQPLSENPLHILVRRSRPDHAEITERFNKALQSMRADGTYERILTRHGH